VKRIFIDTNILVDLIADRKPYSKYAIRLFKKAEQKKIKLFTSSHSIATTHYLLKKYVGEEQLRQIILHITDIVTIVAADQDVIRKALRSNHKDFEDAVQINCASSIDKLACIVTRNIKDFKNSEIEVIPPDVAAGIID
jgi:predicted nucleic acid-binding protein